MTIGTVVLLIAVLACPAIVYRMMRGHRSSAADGGDSHAEVASSPGFKVTAAKETR